MIADYLIVGAGLTGATIARTLADVGHDVLVVERRPHVGGNLNDFTHHSGIRIHAHGPHYFRTSSDGIWAFVRRFAEFYRFEAVLMSEVDGRLEHWPIRRNTFGGRSAPIGGRRIADRQAISRRPLWQ